MCTPGYLGGVHHFSANDYNLLIQMVLNNQRVALGFDHLVTPLVDKWQLIRPTRNWCWKRRATTSPH